MPVVKIPRNVFIKHMGKEYGNIKLFRLMIFNIIKNRS